MEFSREIELKGHIIDSGIMTGALDCIFDMGGNFEFIEFIVGKKPTDESYTRFTVRADTEVGLERILSELHRRGARTVAIDNVNLAIAEGDRIVPKGFYSTTNHPTSVMLGGKSVPVEGIEMDCLIVVKPTTETAHCTPISNLKKGDAVVVGEQGVIVTPPPRPRKASTFEFMHGTVSSERPSETIIKKIAREILAIKAKGGKIGLVGGPAIVHTRAAPSLAKIIREGYIDVLFAGNALAVHDIEYNLFGTSLGNGSCPDDF